MSQTDELRNIWAPELHKLDGKWYVYYAGGEKEDMWNIRPYVLGMRGRGSHDRHMERAWHDAVRR